MSNLNYYFQHDTTTGVLYPYLQETAPASSTQIDVLGPYPKDTATPDVVMAYTYPERYTDQNGQLIQKSYITVTETASTKISGQYTLTATLNNPQSNQTTNCTFTIGETVIQASVTNGQAALIIQLDPSIENGEVIVTVLATGVTSGNISLGSGENVPLKATQVNGIWTVAPQNKSDYENWLFAQMPPTPALFQSVVAMQHLVTDLVRILKVAVNPSLDANQTALWNDLVANVFPDLVLTAENAMAEGVYSDVKVNLIKFNQLQGQLNQATTNFGY